MSNETVRLTASEEDELRFRARSRTLPAGAFDSDVGCRKILPDDPGRVALRRDLYCAMEAALSAGPSVRFVRASPRSRSGKADAENGSQDFGMDAPEASRRLDALEHA